MAEQSERTKQTKLKRQRLIDEAIQIYDSVINEFKGGLPLGKIKAFNAIDMHFDRLKKKEPSNGSLYDSVYFEVRQLIKSGVHKWTKVEGGVNEKVG